MLLPKDFSNQSISQFLTDIATLYIIKKKNLFRIKAYQEAAESIVNYPKPIYQIWQKDKKLLDNIPGIGPSILAKIDYLFAHKKLHPHLTKTLIGIHPAVFAFTKIDGVGPKTAYKLTKEFKFPQNQAAAFKKLIFYTQKGRLSDLPGFGQKSEQLILKNTQNYLDQITRIPLKTAKKISGNIIKYLRQKFPQTKFYPLGSLRRESLTIGDIDIAAQSQQAAAILNHFVKYPQSQKTITHGPKKASIKTKDNVHIDLMVQPLKTFGSLLQHFTGSKQHNIILRKYAQRLGYSLSEYGIKDTKNGKLYTFTDEKKFYNFLKLCFIKPRDRVGDQEIKKAQKCYTKNIIVKK
jgi:DNA polymerase (family 10)